MAFLQSINAIGPAPRQRPSDSTSSPANAGGRRPLRIQFDGAFYHVLARGNERRPIFRDREDYVHFLSLLGVACQRFGLELWSYVLMPNHYHLVIKTEKGNLSRAMQWLAVSYAVWHNKRHGRAGHLLQGRFKSFVISEERYLARLIAYVHRNPVRAGLVERLAEYEWSSYGYLGYGKGECEGVPREAVLRLFGGDGKGFRSAVQEYSEEEGSLLEDLRHGVFLGSGDGLERLRGLIKVKAHPEKPQAKALVRGGRLEDDVERIRTGLGISGEAMEQMKKPIRGRERPIRDALIHALWQEGRHSLQEIGDYFQVRYTAVVNARKRGAAWAARNPRQQRRLVASNDK